MSEFPVDNKELRAAYYHLKNFGQEEHARAILEVAEQMKMMADQYIKSKRRLMKLEAKHGCSYAENAKREVEKRAGRRYGINE